MATSDVLANSLGRQDKLALVTKGRFGIKERVVTAVAGANGNGRKLFQLRVTKLCSSGQ